MCGNDDVVKESQHRGLVGDANAWELHVVADTEASAAVCEH